MKATKPTLFFAAVGGIAPSLLRLVPQLQSGVDHFPSPMRIATYCLSLVIFASQSGVPGFIYASF